MSNGVQTQFSTDPNAIVTVNVSIIEAPTPNTYQRVGAFVSFGATTLSAGSTSYLTQLSDLTQAVMPAVPIVRQPQPVTSAVWAAGTVTVTTQSPIPNVTIGDTVNFVMAGFTPTAYNGFYNCTITAANQFTYALTANPGLTTQVGTYQWHRAIELQQMANTFFGQGNAIGVWVLELGYTDSDANSALALQTWLTANPKTIYGFLLPRKVGSVTATLTAFQSVFQQYQNPEAMEYFWITVTPTTMNQLGPTYKDVIQFVEAPALTDPTQTNLTNPNGEFTEAAMFYNALVYRPSNTNRICPMAFKYLYGVTQYPQKNNGPLLVSFKGANTNYVSTGAEGGISFTMVYEGVTLDGHDYFNWWYTIDWVQIQVNLDLSNAIINGSNNPLAPLYYNQDGINYLEVILFGTMQDAQTFGMVLGKIVMTQLDGPDLTNAIQGGTFAGECDVNAVPFLNYTLANPGDYKIGEYDGLSTLFIPARGFIHILVNVVVTDLISV
jgi:hypothetical protein